MKPRFEKTLLPCVVTWVVVALPASTLRARVSQSPCAVCLLDLWATPLRWNDGAHVAWRYAGLENEVNQIDYVR